MTKSNSRPIIMTSSILMLIDALKRSFVFCPKSILQPTLLAADCLIGTECCSTQTASVTEQAQSDAIQHSGQLFAGDGGRDYFFNEAHAYMLISSPTATSMILGAFQAMLSSLV